MKTRVPIGCITIVFYARRRPGDKDNNIIVVFYAAAGERYSTTVRNTTASLKYYKYVYIFISYATSSRPDTQRKQ